ncbi:phage tail protein [Cupriavidus campinensis]|uniref:Tail fiber protein n=1 Tax=Cupriavidus campinensis TaxID=151783 RepID=A0AAE9I2W0_9BURK|nr:phage tail protein [Cupriavidus campinensis]URF02961.1 tail fiber protein [Cupriavidus campinensis]URF05495.1 tail fiber protein [Cupriavidus campinensis]
MSQHDMVIDNQAGAAFRADLNNALQAVATNQSGGSAPVTTYAYQFWADTSAGLLRMRNAANSAWVTIGLLGVANFGHILPGTIVYHSKNTAPSGYLKANGAAVSRTTYADLFAEIGTVFGAGDGSTTFNLPELRAEFPRGWDDSRGIDSGRVFGSFQVDAFKSHSHTLNLKNTAASGAGSGVLRSTDTDLADSSPVGVSGGSETRPRNVALLACIKY